jgi:hypothetical protein
LPPCRTHGASFSQVVLKGSKDNTKHRAWHAAVGESFQIGSRLSYLTVAGRGEVYQRRFRRRKRQSRANAHEKEEFNDRTGENQRS